MAKDRCDSDANCQSCDSANTCSADEKERHAQQRIDTTLKTIRHTFMVLSGKGGVGKSSVAVNLAATLAGKGSRVGILDADVHGPNIPKMLGVERKKPLAAMGPVDGILPIEAAHNLHVMSIGFFLNNEEDAVIWRGPMKHGLMKQFLGEVHWGDLDYLIIDLPPGTGDEALSIAHLIKKVEGAVIVTTPQDVALLDSKKSITFCRELKIPLIGVVENMSGMLCPHCNKEIALFKVGGGEHIAKKMKVPFLGRVPLDPAMVICTDEGKPFVTAHPESMAAQAFANIARQWVELLAKDNGKGSVICKVFG
jgi:Mrp family chromosome partitioning ATPase